MSGKDRSESYDRVYNQGRADERAKIVAWLRGPAWALDLRNLADAIERGEHNAK